MSRENSTPRPSSSTCQPITSSESGQVCSPLSPRIGPSPAPLISMPAAPSPNRAAATMLLFELSPKRKVRLHSSTTSSSTRRPGRTAAISAARDKPITPPAQPSPNSGRRWVSRRMPSRSISRASRLGVQMPVVETVTMASTSSTPQPASAEALQRHLGQQVRRNARHRAGCARPSHAAPGTIRRACRSGASRCRRCRTPASCRSISELSRSNASARHADDVILRYAMRRNGRGKRNAAAAMRSGARTGSKPVLLLAS